MRRVLILEGKEMIWLDLRRGGSASKFSDSARWLDCHENIVVPDLQNKKVLLLIPGYNTNNAASVLMDVAASAPIHYDEFVGVLWPGGSSWTSFLGAERRAATAALKIFQALDGFRIKATFDINAHSLGCKIALLLQLWPWLQLPVRTVLLLGAAVPNDWLCELCYWVTSGTKRWVVAYSKKDPVLKWAFFAVKLKRALGFSGPVGLTPETVVPLDCSDEVKSHGGYRRSMRVLKEWRNE